MKNPCLDCGTPAADTRCPTCRLVNQRMPPSHGRQQRTGDRGRTDPYNSDYRRRAKQVRDHARICWICGQGRKHDDPWQADHIIPISEGGILSPLAAAHRSCNIRRSNRLMAAKRVLARTGIDLSPTARPAHTATQTPSPAGGDHWTRPKMS